MLAADAQRPFLIAAGDRTVRVVGTQFDVRRREGRLSVTVARGAVEVRPSPGAAGTAYRRSEGVEHNVICDGPGMSFVEVELK